MNTPPRAIAPITETFPPEINGVANTRDHLVDGLRARGHRLQLVRPRQSNDDGLLTRGWPLPDDSSQQWASRPCTNCCASGSSTARQ